MTAQLESGITPRAHRPVPTVVRWLAGLLLRLGGWHVVGDFRRFPKFIAVAHHTSNWDGLIGVAAALSQGVMPHWLGKSELFTGPLGPIMKLAGGIPVDRSRSTNTVAQVAEMFARRPQLVLYVTPSGTRSKATYWKTGFYYMALEAGVPLILGTLDYARKEVGPSQTLWPSGDIRADMAIIRAFYRGQRPRYPQNATPIRLKSELPE